jgi:hypothetical protein
MGPNSPRPEFDLVARQYDPIQPFERRSGAVRIDSQTRKITATIPIRLTGYRAPLRRSTERDHGRRRQHLDVDGRRTR